MKPKMDLDQALEVLREGDTIKVTLGGITREHELTPLDMDRGAIIHELRLQILEELQR